ncbi:MULTISPECIES: TfoX/Sxy family protein [Burkholderia]|uniref:Competence protein TfoX n=1 Tax=Burkholderia mayonis TaxID=1385591 RepID=A0A1B4FPW2_9BURK|nr:MULTISPECIES: TfoX/Sxy family protein [Burkholderia]AOJ05716.1 competence protein TfoX [Burkholderia mayonis]KVE43832.1 competence protein TfoX [Burkholderia mayonis]KVE43964.1 competence protein TfoX [Burkholderia sp. BDU5]
MNWKTEKLRADELAEQLAGFGPIGVARFFSGASLRLDGVLFGFVHEGSLFLRVDDDNRAAFERAGMQPFSYPGRTRTVVVGGYYETPADVLEDVGTLRDWCRDAYRAAVRAGARRAKRK